MKNHLFRNWIALLAALILSLGCAFGESAEPVLYATVNGEEIYDNNADLLELVNYYTNYYTSYGYDTADAGMQALFRSTGLDWAVESALYRQKAEALGIGGLTGEEIAELEAAARAEWEEAVAYYQTQVAELTDESTEEETAAARVSALAYIESNFGYTEESYVKEYVDGSTQTEIRKKVADAEMGEIAVSEQEIIDRFNEMVASDKETYEGNVFMYEYYTQYMGETSYYVPEGYRGITHILLEVDEDLMSTYTDLSARFEEQQNADSEESVEETAEPAGETAESGTEEEAAEAPEEPVTQEMVDAAKQAILDSVQPTVDEIMNKFNAGTPFADLIEEYGTDPGMAAEPNKSQGYMVHEDSILWDPAFITGAMTLEKVGDVSEPVLGSYGIHILFYLRDVPAGAVDMTEEIRNTLKDELQADKENEASSAMMDRWLAESDVQYTEAGLALKAAAEAAQAADDAEEGDGDLEIDLGGEADEDLEIDFEELDDDELEIEITDEEDEAEPEETTEE